MQFVQEHTSQTLEVKQSKFIAHLVPYGIFTQTLAALKEEHPKARHFVVAWRYMNAFDQVIEHCSDDGEPKGTSGKPSLAVLSGNGLINSAVVIVRYFGGTKLGTGGLVRAYSDACNLVIKNSVLRDYVKLDAYVFHVIYTDMSLIEYRLDELGISISDKEFDEDGVIIKASAEESIWKTFHTQNKRIIKMKH
jgi:uncharacterized YigZ family protein